MNTITSASSAPGSVLERLSRLPIWFSPDRIRQNECQPSADSLLVHIDLITSVFAVLYMLTSLAIGFSIGAFLMLMCFALLVSNLFLFRSTGRFRLSANLYLATCTLVAILGCSFFTGGPLSPVAPWFTLIPVAGVLLLGFGRDALFWFVLCCAITLGYGVAGVWGYAFPQYYNLAFAELFSAICAGGLVMIVFAIAVAFDFNRNLAMKKVCEQNETLKSARELADAAAQAKSDFLANMSHEIRTPMNAVIGFAHLCLNLDLSARSRNYVQKINSAATSLLGIINDILDFSKIEAGKLKIESIPFSPDDLLDQVASLFSLKAREKGVELVIGTLSSVPEQLLGDPLRLGQILTNLLGNAIKFTEQGEINLTVETVSVSANVATLRFEVRDSGLGMTPDQLEKLFAAFSQADTSTTRKYGGTGLGLTISKQLVEIMGGELSVESQAGKGSCFRFTLCFPIPASETPRISTSPLIVDKHVLIVDDCTAMQTLLSQLVASLGGKPETADSGEAAITRLLAGEPFDLILMDWHMPGMDGLTAAQRIHASSNPVPVILVTGDEPELAQSCVPHGIIQAYIHKPIKHASLNNYITKVLSGSDMPPHVARPKLAPPSLAGARILLVDDNDFNRQVGRELIEMTGATIDTADNGEQALAAVIAQAYDLVLMDIQMPVMDGYTATRLIRDHKPDLPIIALTAHAMAEEKARSISAGMNDMLSKPILPDRLYAMLTCWLPNGHGEPPPQIMKQRHAMTVSLSPDSLPGGERDAGSLREFHVNAGAGAPVNPAPGIQPEPAGLTDATPNTSYANTPYEGFDLSAALSRVNGDSKMLERFLHLFRERNAASVKEIGAALARQDKETAQRLSHALKGGAGTIGMTGLQAAAARMEATLSSAPPHDMARHGEDFASLETAWAQTMKTLNALLGTQNPSMNDAINPEERIQEIHDERII